MMRESAWHGQIPEHVARHALDGRVLVHHRHMVLTPHIPFHARMKLQRPLRNAIHPVQTIEDRSDPLGSATVCQKRAPFDFQV
jgi:hypothetical protein